MITTLLQAKRHASKYLHLPTLVVGSAGDIRANCDLKAAIKDIESNGGEAFVINGSETLYEKELKKGKTDKTE